MHLYDPPHSLTQDVVISSTSDEFYAKNMYSNYGEELHLLETCFFSISSMALQGT